MKLKGDTIEVREGFQISYNGDLGNTEITVKKMRTWKSYMKTCQRCMNCRHKSGTKIINRLDLKCLTRDLPHLNREPSVRSKEFWRI